MDIRSTKGLRVVVVVASILILVVLVAHQLSNGPYRGSEVLQREIFQEHLTESVNHSLPEKYLLSAKDARSRVHEDPGPYLGFGSIPTVFNELSIREAQYLIHGKATYTPFKCKNMRRMGKKGDGGYYVCLDDPFTFKPGCLVYSFGINNEWSFDEDMNGQFGCEVHSFDPSMRRRDHMHRENMYFHNLGIWGSNFRNDKGWDLRDLKTIIEMLNHTNRVIDYLKIDVEGAEWSLVEHIIQSGVYSQIRQMVLEIHTPRLKGTPLSLRDYGEVFHSQHELDNVGFEKYLYQNNNDCCGRFAILTPEPIVKFRLCCYELFYINKRFLQKGAINQAMTKVKGWLGQ